MQTDKEKAEEILKKRRLAAMGLKERGDGKQVAEALVLEFVAAGVRLRQRIANCNRRHVKAGVEGSCGRARSGLDERFGRRLCQPRLPF